VICWSCEREAGAGLTCPACGALLPPPAPAPDVFAVLGVPRRFALSAAEVEARYKDLSRQVHPDRFAKADPRAQRASLARTVQLNEAWRTVKDPVRRAEALLALHGVTVASENDRSVPPALLMEILELREELGEARLAGDGAKVRAMGAAMQARVDASMAAIAAALDAGGADRLQEAAAALVALRYYRRFLDEVGAHEESEAARAEEAGGHAG
jgi:molecular chaperone HscB